MLLREHRFKFLAGAETHLFRIEELVKGVVVWPQQFRLTLPASASAKSKTFYGASCYEVAEKAADFMARNSGHSERVRATHSSQRPPTRPPRALQIQAQESD
jgi:hypothetical protein